MSNRLVRALIVPPAVLLVLALAACSESPTPAAAPTQAPNCRSYHRPDTGTHA